MSVIDRIRQLQLPLDQVVVIGSGVLDALNLRPASDIDLVVSEKLFADLKDRDNWILKSKSNGEPFLIQDDIEAWMSWGSQGVPNFESLYADGLDVEGVKFVNLDFLIDQKRQRGSEKDLSDIAMIERYQGE